MQAGKLRHRVRIEQPTRTRGETYRESTITWSLYQEVWGAVEPLSGREIVQADQVVAGLTHRVRIRYLAGVTAGMRVNFGGRYLNIESVINKEERNIELELLCMEKQ